MTKRVAIYCRVSTNDQSCERQLVELREVAENHNWEVVQEYVDTGVSGAKTSRPQLDSMMKDAFSRKFEMVLTLELSRIGRNTKHLLEIVERLRENHQSLHPQSTDRHFHRHRKSVLHCCIRFHSVWEGFNRWESEVWCCELSKEESKQDLGWKEVESDSRDRCWDS